MMIISQPSLLAFRPPGDNSGAFPTSKTGYGCLYTFSVNLRLSHSSRLINRHLISISVKQGSAIVARGRRTFLQGLTQGLLTVTSTFSTSPANPNIPFCHGFHVLESAKEMVSFHDNKAMSGNASFWKSHCNVTVTATNAGGTSTLMTLSPSITSIDESAVTLMFGTNLIGSTPQTHMANLTNIASCSSITTTKSDEGTVILNKYTIELIKARTVEPSRRVIVQDEAALDSTEKHRRNKISRANRGKIPWNKGKSHSAETIAKIKDRTREAMRDPIIQEKLRYHGLTQSKETRLKISKAATKRWNIIKCFRQQQYTCITEWKESIAAVATRGGKGDKEFQWNSFTVLKQQTQEEKKRRDQSMASCKTYIQSIESKKKIEEKITAKWTDPNPQQNVIQGLHAYLDRNRQQVGICNLTKRARESPICAEVHLSERENSVANLPIGQPISSSSGGVDMFSVKSKLPYNFTSYSDPLAMEKLEILRQIRFKRLAKEAKRKEATDRVWMLMAEAEKAVRILEIAAIKDRRAMTLLLHTRKLLAEAAWSIQTSGLGRDDGCLAPARYMDIWSRAV